MNELFAQAGGLPEIAGWGGVVAGVLWLLHRVLENHRSERKEWNDTTLGRIEKLDEKDEKRCERTETVFRELCDAIQEQTNKK